MESDCALQRFRIITNAEHDNSLVIQERQRRNLSQPTDERRFVRQEHP